MKRRTKEQKRKAQQERITEVAQASESTARPQSTFTYTGETSSSSKSDLRMNTTMIHFVRVDLIKTGITATLLFIALVGIYFYLRYN